MLVCHGCCFITKFGTLILPKALPCICFKKILFLSPPLSSFTSCFSGRSYIDHNLRHEAPKASFFPLEDVTVDSYKLNAYSGSTLFVSSVVTLTLNAQNHNKVSIWYSPSHLEALYDGLPIGTIQIPGFLQPACSSNVSMQTRDLFPCVNASQIVAEASLQEDSRKNMFQMKIVDDVGAHLLVFHIILLKIKVALECDINIDYRELTNKYEVYNTIEAFQASFPSYPKTLFMNCFVHIEVTNYLDMNSP